MSPERPGHPTLRAALWMTGAIASFSAMAIAGRAVSLAHDTFELMLYRSLIGIVVMTLAVSLTGAWPGVRAELSPARMGLHFIRNISHFTGQNLWFYAITMIPLAQVFALEFTSPLWVLLLAPLLLGEPITRPRALAAVLGFIGILFVAQPGTAPLSPGLLAAATAAIGFAGSAIFTRKLTRATSTVVILFWLTVMQAGFGIVTAGYDGDIALPSTGSAPWLVLIGLAGLFAHFCLTSALRLAPASVVMPIDFTRLPLIAVLGYVVYDETLSLGLIAGAVLILAGNGFNLAAEARRK